MSMSTAEQRIALAEWAKWEPREYVILPNTHVLPIDIITDLNAVHELEKRLNQDQLRAYGKALAQIIFGLVCYDLCLDNWTQILKSTASQRCEALCRVLWPERFK